MESSSPKTTKTRTNVLVVMQGAPGSGKSSLAAVLQRGFIEQNQDCVVCSTDDFFYDAEGVYNFDPTKLGEYHAKNLRRTINYLNDGYTVIVDNTNVRAWQARTYVEAAVKLGIPISFVRCEGSFENIHGVPENVVDRMRTEMEELSVAKCLAATSPF